MKTFLTLKFYATLISWNQWNCFCIKICQTNIYCEDLVSKWYFFSKVKFGGNWGIMWRLGVNGIGFSALQFGAEYKYTV